jgi:hypothetical protein
MGDCLGFQTSWKGVETQQYTFWMWSLRLIRWPIANIGDLMCRLGKMRSMDLGPYHSISLLAMGTSISEWFQPLIESCNPQGFKLWIGNLGPAILFNWPRWSTMYFAGAWLLSVQQSKCESTNWYIYISCLGEPQYPCLFSRGLR